ncbi:uncharacterized protein LOC144582346 isoform X3 [Callithrix jacchus]
MYRNGEWVAKCFAQHCSGAERVQNTGRQVLEAGKSKIKMLASCSKGLIAASSHVKEESVEQRSYSVNDQGDRTSTDGDE